MDERIGSSWKTFVARQPILDGHKNIFAYELLFRSSLENVFQSGLPDQASSSVLVSSLFLIGIQSITGGRRAFVNFTRNLLTQGYAAFLPPEQAVIEILEDVMPDSDIVDACEFLKKTGYILALDDYPLDGRMDPLLPFVDIVKVDWLKTPPEVCRKLAHDLIPKGIRLLAEKVETHEQYRQAQEMGYSYFQGFFFCEPEVLTGRDIPTLQTNCMMLLREVNGDDPKLNAIERVLMREPSLCYKLLRYLNSAIFYFRGNITSVRHALSLLGLEAIRKWVSLVTLAGMGENKPEALVVTSVIRGKFCESIGQAGNQSKYSTELFLMGIFSLIDAILDKPMDKLLYALPISSEIRDTLLGKESPYQAVYKLVCAYERSNWDAVASLAETLYVSEENVAKAYIDAVAWAQELTSASKN
ncbi:MAG: HDOD domain-containing protein [Acidobacteria bacterium]|nr:HDOD domain-containing protein [Acidobacteriota bacterium]